MKKQADKTYAPNADPKIMDLLSLHFPHSASALDLGCGLGGNLLAARKAGLTVTGITISSEEAKVASKIGEVHLFDLESGLPVSIKSKQYDVIIASHLLEHIFYPEKILHDIGEVVQMGAIIVIPNLLYWRNRIKMMLGKFEYQEIGIMDYTHSRWYTYKTIQELLLKRGFLIENAVATGGIFKTESRFKAVINRLLVHLFPGLFGFQFYIVVSKKG